jgi:hypothetical protein
MSAASSFWVMPNLSAKQRFPEGLPALSKTDNFCRSSSFQLEMDRLNVALVTFWVIFTAIDAKCWFFGRTFPSRPTCLIARRLDS